MAWGLRVRVPACVDGDNLSRARSARADTCSRYSMIKSIQCIPSKQQIQRGGKARRGTKPES
eukprot:1692834-Pleurochrysis_carterae.AAC.2